MKRQTVKASALDQIVALRRRVVKQPKHRRKTSPEALAFIINHMQQRGQPKAASRDVVTLEALAARLAVCENITELFLRTESVDGVPGLMTLVPMGVMTNYWLLQALMDMVGLSIGIGIGWCAVYGEIDTVTNPNRPSVAGYFANCAVNPFGQPNHAIEGVAANSPKNRGLTLTLGDKVLIIRPEGVELQGNWSTVQMGKIGGLVKQLWP